MSIHMLVVAGAVKVGKLAFVAAKAAAKGAVVVVKHL